MSDFADPGSPAPLVPATWYVLDEHLRVRWSSEPYDEKADEVEREVRKALGDSSPLLLEHAYHRADGSPSGRTFSLSAHRLDGLDDLGAGFRGLIVAVQDVTERDRTRRREAASAAVRAAVGRSLDVTVTCRQCAQALVPGFADIAVVDVVDDVLRGEEPPPAPLGRDVPLRCAAACGADTTPPRPEGEVRSTPYRTPQARCLSDLLPRLADLSDATEWLAADPAQALLIETFGARSLLTVPLTLQGAVLGLLSLYRLHGSEPYDERDVTVAADLAAHAALSLDNARRYERDHTIASTVQRHLLPRRVPSPPALETAHVHVPGSNSGCWFDAIALPGARTALVVGNVAGHGIETAATMGQLRMVINALAVLDLDPDELLARLDDTVTRLAAERTEFPAADAAHHKPLTADCLYGVYDPFTRTCTLARAGNLSPLVVRPDGHTFLPDLPDGPALGAGEPVPFAAITVPLDEGSVLAFRTGAFGPEDADPSDPVRRAVAHPGRPLRDLCDAAVYALPADRDPDGAVLLLARTGTLPTDHAAAVELPHDPTSPAQARTFTREHLAAWHVDETTSYATELIVSELLTNAVRYGTPPVILRLIRTDTLTCEIHDTGAAAPHLRHARTVDEGGRGLFIVSQLAARWGTRYTPSGKILWTEQPLTATVAASA
ncbi:SpoIIE family protein phosphatase [Streptomyces sp. NPDC127197]|uniref:ATP-binding SpoIIE family protein phosphatase n=1 Tax=Streptomyces sp. NPDC127197 TaxID=3345388 RepID=UPI0036399602